MNKLALVTLLFCPLLPSALHALEAAPHVRIAARYEGFDRTHFADVQKFNDTFTKEKKAGVMAAPSVTVKPGQSGTIEIIREVKVPTSPSGEQAANAGVTLEVKPIVKDGEITLSGKSVVRRKVQRDQGQPLGAVSFATQETFFGGAIQQGKELSIPVGDGPEDKARVILTVQLVDANGAPLK